MTGFIGNSGIVEDEYEKKNEPRDFRLFALGPG